MRRFLSGSVLTAAMVLGGATAAFATTEYPAEGGRWDYGYIAVSQTMNSDYYHDSRCHGSSVKHGVDRWDRSVDTAGGYTAHAGLGWVGVWDNREYYYRVC